MADSGGVTASMSKNQKKRARKKLKKAEEADEASGGGGDMGEKGERGGDEEAESERREEEKVVVVRDPVAELKEKLSEAKSSQDHETAQKLREQLWRLRDKGATDPTFSAVYDQMSSTVPQQHLLTSSDTSSSSSDPLSKKMSKLKKKLKQIESLEERLEKGEKLEANQLTKVAFKQEVLDEIAETEEILAVT